jgi:hypothetical protein
MKNKILTVVATFVLGAMVSALLPNSGAFAAVQDGVSGNSDVAVSGIVRALMATSAGESGSPLQEMILDTNQGVFTLDEDQYKDLNPGDTATVRVAGSDLDDVVMKAQLAPTTSVYAPIADRRLLVVPVQWENSLFSDTRMAKLNTVTASLKTWWSTTSMGIENLTINTLPVQNIAPDSTCGYLALRASAMNAAIELGLNSWFTNLAIVLPDQNMCWWGGLGAMPGDVTWINAVTVKVFAHELGHNMGLPHANSCIGTLTVSTMQECQHNEYGDPTDVMGYGADNAIFGAAYLHQIGWLDSSKVATWSGSTVSMSIAPLRDAAGAIRAIRIPSVTELGNDGPGDYWLQLRTGDAVPSRNGLFMNLVPTTSHIAATVSSTPQWGRGLFTWLCDLTPSGQMDWDFKFVVGAQWNDPQGRFRITLTALGANFATVTIAPSTVLPVAPQAVSTRVETDEMGLITGNIRVDWNAVAPRDNTQTEPVQWIASTQEGQFCIAAVRERSCVIRRVARQKSLLIQVISKNYAGSSPGPSVAVDRLPITPPTMSLDITPTATGASVDVLVDDGGSTVMSMGISVNGQSCVFAGMSCRIEGLQPNTEYKAVALAANAAGSRQSETSFLTLFRVPASPRISFVKMDGFVHLRATVNADELNNVQKIFVYCSPIHSQWLIFDSIRKGITVQIPSTPVTRNQGAYCFVRVWNPEGATTKSARSPLVKFDKPESLKNSFAKNVRFSVKKSARNDYRVSWKFTGAFASGSKTRVVMPRIQGRACVRVSSTSCVYKGLVVKRTQSVKIKVSKKATPQNFQGQKVVRLRK